MSGNTLSFLTWFRSTPWPLLAIGLGYVTVGVLLDGIISVASSVAENSYLNQYEFTYWLVIAGFNAEVILCLLWGCWSVGELAWRSAVCIGILGLMIVAVIILGDGGGVKIFSLNDWLFSIFFHFCSAMPAFVFARLALRWRVVDTTLPANTKFTSQLSIRDLFTLTFIAACVAWLYRKVHLEIEYITVLSYFAITALSWLILLPLSHFILRTSSTKNKAMIVGLSAPLLAAIPSLTIVVAVFWMSKKLSKHDDVNEAYAIIAIIFTFCAMMDLLLISLPLALCKYCGYELRTGKYISPTESAQSVNAKG